MSKYLLVSKIDIGETENELEKNNIIILFAEADTKKKFIVISIGEAEAHSIFLALNNEKYSRPLTHDFIQMLLEAFKATI